MLLEDPIHIKVLRVKDYIMNQLIIGLMVLSLIGGTDMGRLNFTGSPRVRSSGVAPSYPFGNLPIATRPTSGLPRAPQLATSPQALQSMIDYIKKTQAGREPLPVPAVSRGLPTSQQRKTPYTTPTGGSNAVFKKRFGL